MKNTEELMKELTIEEKAALLEGYNSWMTNAVPRLGIPSVHLTDGPTGVRKKTEDRGSGVLGLGKSYPSTAFPTAVTIADSWNEENAEKMGKAIGEECRIYGVAVLLGPALNLKRDPRCGRNFEYYSEDPLLSGKMAAAAVRGIQSTGTAACPKHFALNNSENHRYMSNSVIDERAAGELYLRSFEICVKEGKPETMMCAYNMINGTHCSENRQLLTDILRSQWGFDGAVMTDWGATKDRLEGLRAGVDLDMPGGIWENRKAIIDAAGSGDLPTEVLDRAVRNVLNLISRVTEERPPLPNIDTLLREHDALTVNMASDSAVLLKNDGVLPLGGKEKILVTGELFRKMRFQGAGSSGLNPAFLTSPEDAFRKAGITYTFSTGYRESENTPDKELEEETLKAAETADTVLFFGGLTELYESEGFDRENLSLPENQLSLINRLTAAGKKIVVVLFGGGVMELPFADDVSAILYMALPGQGGGEACRRLLWGEDTPDGRLSETWVGKCSDIPYGEKFSRGKTEEYRENIYVGYRYYDEAPKKILYPFGYGLSYTTFAWSGFSVRHEKKTITVTLDVENTGRMKGAEVVQIYTGKNGNSSVFKAEKELRTWKKVYLEPGEKMRVTLTFNEEDLAYYNTKEKRWVIENGEYPVYAASSARDIKERGSITIEGYESAEAPYSENTLSAYSRIAECRIPDDVFEETLGYPIPSEPPVRPYTVESPIGDYQNSFMGRMIYNGFMKGIAGNQKKIDRMPDGPEKTEIIKNQQFVMNLIPRNSTRALIQSGGGRIQMNMARAIVEFANGHIIRGLKEITKKDTPLPLPSEKEKE